MEKKAFAVAAQNPKAVILIVIVCLIAFWRHSIFGGADDDLHDARRAAAQQHTLRPQQTTPLHPRARDTLGDSRRHATGFVGAHELVRNIMKHRETDVMDFCYTMLAGKQYLRTRVLPALDTWLRGEYVMLFIERGDVGTALARRVSSPRMRVEMLDYAADDIMQRSPGGAWKNMFMVRTMYESAPLSRWYVMVDDDTYVFRQNLRLELKNHMHDYMTSRKLFGSLFPACLGTMNFTHGGGGMFFNRAALEAIGPHADACQVKYTWRKDVSNTNCYGHTGGDARSSLCLTEVGRAVLHDLGHKAWRLGLMKAFHQFEKDEHFYLVSVHEVRLPDLFTDLFNAETNIALQKSASEYLYLREFRSQFNDEKKYSSIVRKPWSYVDMREVTVSQVDNRFVKLHRVRMHGSHLEDHTDIARCKWVCYEKMYWCNVVQVTKTGACLLKNQPPLPMRIITPREAETTYKNQVVPYAYAVVPPFNDDAAATEVGYILVSTSSDGFKRFRAMLKNWVGSQAFYAVFDKNRVLDIPSNLTEFYDMHNVVVDVIDDAKNDADLVVRASRNFNHRLGFKDWYGLISDRTFVMSYNMRGTMAQYYRIHFRPLMIVTSHSDATTLDGGMFFNDLAMAMFMEHAVGCVEKMATTLLNKPNLAFEQCVKMLYDKHCPWEHCQAYNKQQPVFMLRTSAVFYEGVAPALRIRADESTLFPLSFGNVDVAGMEVLGRATRQSSGDSGGMYVKYTTWGDIKGVNENAD